MKMRKSLFMYTILIILGIITFLVYPIDKVQAGTMTTRASVTKTQPAGRWCSGPHQLQIQTTINMAPYIYMNIDCTKIEWYTPIHIGTKTYQGDFANIRVFSNIDAVIEFAGVENLVPDKERTVAEHWWPDIASVPNEVVEARYVWDGFEYPAEGEDSLNDSYTYLVAGAGTEQVEIDGQLLPGAYKMSLKQRMKVGPSDSQNIWFHDPGGFTMTIAPNM